MKKRYKVGLVFLVVGLVSGGLFLHFSAPYMILKPMKRTCNSALSDNIQAIEIYGQDSVLLKGIKVEAKDSTVATMILLHGIGGSHCHFEGTARNLANSGITSLVLSHRAHAESEGAFCTYGFYEKMDVSKLVDYLESQYPGTKVGIWGHSLGGAIALQSMAYDPRIDFGISESSFANLDQVVNDYQNRMFGVGWKWLSDFVLSRAAEIGNFDALEVSPEKVAGQITQPIFIGHGVEDERISIKRGEAIYNALASPNKVFYPIEGAKHNNLYDSGGEPYVNALTNFITQHMQ